MQHDKHKKILPEKYLVRKAFFELFDTLMRKFHRKHDILFLAFSDILVNFALGFARNSFHYYIEFILGKSVFM